MNTPDMNTSATHSPASAFYLWRDEKQAGPYTINQLKAMWRSGSVTGDMLFCGDGMNDWLPLATLQHELEAAPPAHDVAVRQIDPFAAVHTPIQGRKAGRLSVIGLMGIVLGLLLIVAGVALVVMPESNEAAQRGGVSVLLAGATFTLGCYFWARR